MKLKLQQFLSLALITGVAFVSCRKNEYAQNTPIIIKEYVFPVSTASQLHPVSSPAFTKDMKMEIFDDNSITYEIYEDSAGTRSDVITSVEIRSGDSSVNGPIIALLPGKYRSGWATGTVGNFRKSFIYDTMMNANVQKYLNVVSTQEPLGLVRGQIR